MADDINTAAITRHDTSHLSLAKFIIPTLLGIFLFLTPLTVDGKQTIIIGVLTDLMRAPLEPFVLEIVVLVVVLGAVGSGYFVIRKPDWQYAHPALHAMCHTTPVWFFIRAVGAVAGLMVYFQFGPEIVWGTETGRTVFMNIGVPVFFIFVVACFLLPLLTDYGFMEFVGAMLRRPFTFLFRLPGRSAIDATASFVSASSVGLLITISQYNRGYYTAREAAAVATNFSIVSVPFSLVVAEVAGLSHMFFTWYLVVLMACLLCALITVRIPPLIWLPNDYNPMVGKQIHEDFTDSDSAFKNGVNQALGRAAHAPNLRQFIKNGWLSSLDVVFGVIGPAMAITTLATIIAVHTPVFDVISWPIYYVLDTVGIPEAQAAAPGFVVGFLDMFMPALVAQNIESELTRFVLAGLSIAQLVYMAEVGVIVLRSNLPLNFWELLAIFIVRTVILFPIFLVMGLWLL